MRFVGLLIDIFLLICTFFTYPIIGFQLLAEYPDLQGLGMLGGLVASVVVLLVQPSIFKALSVIKEGTSQIDSMFSITADRFVILGLAVAWSIGLAGTPILNWLPAVILIMLALFRVLRNNSKAGSGWLDWANSRARDVDQLNKWEVAAVVLLAVIPAEISGAMFGSLIVTGLVYVAVVAAAFHTLLEKREIAALDKVREVIKTNSLVEMEKAYVQLDRSRLPKSSVLLLSAIRGRRAEYALLLEVAGLNPKTSYYYSIFKAAAKNILDGQYGVQFQFRNLGSTEAIYRFLHEDFHRFIYGDDFHLKAKKYEDSISRDQPRSELTGSDIGKYAYFQTTKDYEKYDQGLKRILHVINAILGESLLFESEHGLEIIAERGCFRSAGFTSGLERSDGLRLINQPAAIRICLASEYERYIGYRLITPSFIFRPGPSRSNSVDRIEPLTVHTKTAQDLAIFYSQTLGIPYEAMIGRKRDKGLSRVSMLSNKVLDLVKDELKGQAEEAAIMMIAVKLFDEDAELVISLMDECMNDRVTEELADLIAEVIVAQAVEAGIGILNSALSE